jgi:hypothetical protein
VGRGRGSGPSLTHGGLNVVRWCCWGPLEEPAPGLMAGIWWLKTGGLWKQTCMILDGGAAALVSEE